MCIKGQILRAMIFARVHLGNCISGCREVRSSEVEKELLRNGCYDVLGKRHAEMRGHLPDVVRLAATTVSVTSEGMLTVGRAARSK